MGGMFTEYDSITLTSFQSSYFDSRRKSLVCVEIVVNLFDCNDVEMNKTFFLISPFSSSLQSLPLSLCSNGSMKYNTTFMRKVPAGTEAHVLLLAEIPALNKGKMITHS